MIYDDRFGTTQSPATALVPGSLRGYRCWDSLRPFSHKVLLRAVSWEVLWRGSTIEADCRRFACACLPCRLSPQRQATSHEHRAPVPYCSCGIYGWYLPNRLSRDHSGPIVGVIQASGRVLMGSLGFRAQRATVLAVAPIRSHPGQLNLDRTKYPDVRVLKDLDALLSAYPPDLDTVRNMGIEPPDDDDPSVTPY